ncbi:MAG TPA: amidohydrolase family protein [Acidimicrobiia bacterium]|nr:amidohydrolase family protein [Acidimicrobiia bacterium]
MSHRLLVRGGLVVDGTGRAARPADVLIEGDTIVAIGAPAHHGNDATVIEAGGAVVAPGFIDLHTHADHSILAFPSADSALRQGVTTIAVGNCGGGVAPISPEHDVRPVAFASRPEWGQPTWARFPEYLDHLDGLGVNVAAMVPHGALRNAVMGIDPRPATEAELATMREMLKEALAAGAVGMSTGLQYRPGCWATEAEIRTLVESVGERGGIYATHMRDRSKHYLAAIDEAVRATVDTGAHLQLSHVVARPNAPADEIDRAVERMWTVADGRFGVDTFPEPWGPGLLVDLFPTELMDGDTARVLARLADPTTRRAMEAYIDAESSFLARIAGYDEIFLSWVPDRPDLTGVSLGSVGERVGAFCCDVLAEAGGRLREIGIRHVYADDGPLSAVIAFPFCSVASDGIVTSGEDMDCPLPWSASTYGFTARLLETYVRDRRLLTVEEAVRRLTSLPAAALGLEDRGVLATGKRADLVIFDPDRIHDRSEPTAMARHPLGIDRVVVNGVVAVEAEGLTHTLAGRVLRSP